MCRICAQAAPARPLDLVSNGYRLFRCEACRCILVERRPSAEELARLYDYLFSEGAYEAHRREFEALVQGYAPVSHYRQWLLRATRIVTAGDRLVEIGGGTGAFARIAQDAGYRYIDYDVSKVAVESQRKLGNNAFWFPASELPPVEPATADVLVMWEVIEHVWNVDGYLRKIREAVRPGGSFLFSTPNFFRPGYRDSLQRGDGSSPPIHLNFFTVQALRTALKVHGWDRVRFASNRIRPGLPKRAQLRTALGLDPAETIFCLAR